LKPSVKQYWVNSLPPMYCSINSDAPWNSIMVTNIGQPSNDGLFGTNNDDVLFSFS
jgi:hypothetical protein